MRWIAPLLALLLATAPVSADDEPGVWKVEAGTKLKLSWSYTLNEKTTHTDEGDTRRKETRTVKATLTAPKAFKGRGHFDLVVDSVDWKVETEGFVIHLTKGSAEAAPKVDKELTDSDYDGDASQEVEEMTDYVGRSYRLRVRPGQASMLVKGHSAWAGGADAPSLFNRCYVQSDLPDDERLKSTIKWIDERESEYLPFYHPPGRIEDFPKVQLRLQLASSGLSVKGKGTSKFKGTTILNWKYAGKSSIKRSFAYSAAGYLEESSEEAKSAVKRTNLTKPGKSTGTLSITQSLSLTAAGDDQ